MRLRSARSRRGRGPATRTRGADPKALDRPPAEWYDQRQREQVGGGHPLDHRHRDLEVAAQRVDGDVDDRRVEDRHDQGRDHERRQPDEARGEGLSLSLAVRCIAHAVHCIILVEMPNRAPELMWEEPASPDGGLTRAAIVRAAIELADAEGL